MKYLDILANVLVMIVLQGVAFIVAWNAGQSGNPLAWLFAALVLAVAIKGSIILLDDFGGGDDAL